MNTHFLTSEDSVQPESAEAPGPVASSYSTRTNSPMIRKSSESSGCKLITG